MEAGKTMYKADLCQYTSTSTTSTSMSTSTQLTSTSTSTEYYISAIKMATYDRASSNAETCGRLCSNESVITVNEI